MREDKPPEHIDTPIVAFRKLHTLPQTEEIVNPQKEQGSFERVSGAGLLRMQ